MTSKNKRLRKVNRFLRCDVNGLVACNGGLLRINNIVMHFHRTLILPSIHSLGDSLYADCKSIDRENYTLMSSLCNNDHHDRTRNKSPQQEIIRFKSNNFPSRSLYYYGLSAYTRRMQIIAGFQIGKLMRLQIVSGVLGAAVTRTSQTLRS